MQRQLARLGLPVLAGFGLVLAGTMIGDGPALAQEATGRR
jgi:hypothetical protein